MTKSMLIMRPSDDAVSNIENLGFDELLATFGQIHGAARITSRADTRGKGDERAV
jgi:hypothetical protein